VTSYAITGLEAEAKIARRAGIRAVVIGGGRERRAAALTRAIAEGATGFISFGIAGGLDPRLRPGAVLLPEMVHSEAGESYPVDVEWRRLMIARIPDGIGGSLYGAETVVATAREKRALFDRTKSIAVDLESAAVASAAATSGIPFIVLRTVADPAHRSLPRAAVKGLTGEGKVAFGAVFGHLARRPHQLPALLFIAVDTRKALAAIHVAAPAVRR